MMSVNYVYLLTLAHGDTYELVGVFLDPMAAQSAKLTLEMRGVRPDLLDIDHAPIGIVDLRGIDKPYFQGPLH